MVGSDCVNRLDRLGQGGPGCILLSPLREHFHRRGMSYCSLVSLVRMYMTGCNLHKVSLLNLIPSGSTLLACSDTFDLFCLVIFHNQIDQLAVVRSHRHGRF
jgi:hypothetical protein